MNVFFLQTTEFLLSRSPQITREVRVRVRVNLDDEVNTFITKVFQQDMLREDNIIPLLQCSCNRDFLFFLGLVRQIKKCVLF